VVEGTSLSAVTRLKNDGLLSYRWEESHQDHQKILWSYRDGTDLNERQLSTWTELSDAVNLITNQKNSHEQDCKYKLRRNVLSYRRRCIPEINTLF
jgi:hypothetical protein